ncbi:putative Elongin-A [Glarea lozoyensis 74030]|uniref:Putative Elongin-A n=1 Tax=Glarea lozoyensis (strain ATCC 74030 / MF5533) TaxID=1104152 RepID=H0EFN3_GLAL7|nr:putative Elongin-A [Glarea lozoyensis 74030]
MYAQLGAPKLIDSCTRACIKNIRSLTDIGDFEYRQIKNILDRIDSPEQLHQIEINSPQIRGEDAELWQKFIARDIPNWKQKNWAPKNPTKWYEVYVKYKKDQAQEIARDEEILRNAMMGLKKHKAGNVSQIVSIRDRTLPKLPRDPRMIANNGGVPLKGKTPPSSLNWTAGSKTKMSDPKGVLARARREAAQIAQMGKLATPTHQLGQRKNQIRQAPAGMANEYRLAAQPALKILSGKRKTTGSYSGGVAGPSLEEREAKLRALTGHAGATANYVGSSDDDDDDILAGGYEYDQDEEEEDGDDLFDEKPERSSQARLVPTSQRKNQMQCRAA